MKNHYLPRGLHQSVIEKDTIVIEFGTSIESLATATSQECSICYGEYTEKEQVRLLKCGHDYHKECIDEWLTRHRNRCPMCMHIVGGGK